MRAAIVWLLFARAAHAGVDDDVLADADEAWCDGRAISYDEGARVQGERVFVRRAHASCRGGASFVLATGAGWTRGRLTAVAWDRAGLDELWRKAEAIVQGPGCGADRDATDVEVRAGDTSRRCAAFVAREVVSLAHALDTPPVKPRPDEDHAFVFFIDDAE